MGLLNWGKDVVKKMSVYDIAVLKTFCVVLGIIIGAYIAGFVKQYVAWFAIVAVVLYAYLLYKVFWK